MGQIFRVFKKSKIAPAGRKYLSSVFLTPGTFHYQVLQFYFIQCRHEVQTFRIIGGSQCITFNVLFVWHPWYVEQTRFIILDNLLLISFCYFQIKANVTSNSWQTRKGWPKKCSHSLEMSKKKLSVKWGSQILIASGDIMPLESSRRGLRCLK